MYIILTQQTTALGQFSYLVSTNFTVPDHLPSSTFYAPKLRHRYQIDNPAYKISTFSCKFTQKHDVTNIMVKVLDDDPFL